MNMTSEPEGHLQTETAEATHRLGEAFGVACRGGEVLLLAGDLGSGKTCFTQGLARGLGVTQLVTSPTFVLHARYPGRLQLEHIDLYRLGYGVEWASLGFDEFLGAPQGVTVVEWADLLDFPPAAAHVLVQIDIQGPGARRFSFSPSDEANRYNVLAEPYLYQGALALLGERANDFQSDYKFDISPASDDRPYFHNFFKV